MRDVNGRVAAPGRWDGKWGQRLRAAFGVSAETGTELAADDIRGVVVAESGDPAVASSTALESSSWSPDGQAIVRHLLTLPPETVDDAVATAALDSYVRLDVDDDALAVVIDQAGGYLGAPGHIRVVLGRVQLVDAVHLSQERSRMASLGSRHGGTVVGWQVLQIPA